MYDTKKILTYKSFINKLAVFCFVGAVESSCDKCSDGGGSQYTTSGLDKLIEMPKNYEAERSKKLEKAKAALKDLESKPIVVPGGNNQNHNNTIDAKNYKYNSEPMSLGKKIGVGVGLMVGSIAAIVGGAMLYGVITGTAVALVSVLLPAVLIVASIAFIGYSIYWLLS